MERRNKKTKSVGNGEGSLYYSEALKKWIYQYYDTNNKRKTMTQKKKESVKEFKARVTDLKNKLNNGTYIEKSKDSLLEIIEHYINQKFEDGITSEVSYKRNTETINSLKKCCENFINIPIQRVSIEDIEKSKKKMSTLYSQSCIKKMWGLLGKGFSIAYSRRKIDFNIMLDETLTMPISKKEQVKIEALTIDEEKRFKELLDGELRNHKYRNAVKTQFNTGMRIGEVLARSKKDYKKETKKLFIHNTLTKNKHDKVILGKHTKTYNKRTGVDLGKREIPLFDDTEEIILEELDKKLVNMYGLIFWDYQKNTFISGNEINSWLDRINKKYKITNKKFSTHVLRHTRITRWREAGVSILVIQYWAGHVEGSNITDNTYFTLQEDFINNEYEKIQQA